jgi:hypothetical protein
MRTHAELTDPISPVKRVISHIHERPVYLVDVRIMGKGVSSIQGSRSLDCPDLERRRPAMTRKEPSDPSFVYLWPAFASCCATIALHRIISQVRSIVPLPMALS